MHTTLDATFMKILPFFGTDSTSDASIPFSFKARIQNDSVCECHRHRMKEESAQFTISKWDIDLRGSGPRKTTISAEIHEHHIEHPMMFDIPAVALSDVDLFLIVDWTLPLTGDTSTAIDFNRISAFRSETCLSDSKT